MKLFFVILFVIVLFLPAVSNFSLFSSCRSPEKSCTGMNDCCPVNSRRMVCASNLKICRNKKCCITEVQEQEEKQAAIQRNRNPKPKRLLNILLNEDEEEE